MLITDYEERYPRKHGESRESYAYRLRRSAIEDEVNKLRCNSLSPEVERILDIIEALNDNL